MPARVLALLLAILMAAGAASPVLAATDDAMGQRDDLLDPEPVPTPALVSSVTALASPARHELSPAFAPTVASHGRLHCAVLFRPPR